MSGHPGTRTFPGLDAQAGVLEGRWLAFSAEVRDQEGVLLARAQASHWIVDLPEDTDLPD